MKSRIAKLTGGGINTRSLGPAAVLIIGLVSVSSQVPQAAETVSPPHPPRRLVVCLDGTWASPYNKVARHGQDGHEYYVLKPSNPLKMCRAVLPFDAATARVQMAYYDIGVGALAEYPGLENVLLQMADRGLGGASGAGFEDHIEKALHFLALNVEQEDEVFIFGFSRGAATARAVTHFLDWSGGLPEKEDAYYLPILFREYVTSRGASADQPAKLIREKNLKPFRPVRVKYLGVWDTVLALGPRFRRTPTRQFYLRSVPAKGVGHARQALAVDEHRADFLPEIWTGHWDHQTMEQRWFPGVHTNIGGGYNRDGLADIAFNWMLEGAIAEGLKVNGDYVKHYEGRPAGCLYESSSLFYRVFDFIRFRNGRRHLTAKPETDPNLVSPVKAAGNIDLDRSVIRRMQAAITDIREPQNCDDDKAVLELYRPENVIQFLAKQPDLGTYLKGIGVQDGETIPLPEDVKRRIDEIRNSGR